MNRKINKEDLEFEITFYNGLIQKKPDFAEALIALGDIYTKAGMFKEGLAVDEQLARLRPADPAVLYNLACSYSLLQEVDKAYRAMKKAINCGYDNFTHLEQDQDLVNLRNDRRFQEYLSRVKDKAVVKSQE